MVCGLTHGLRVRTTADGQALRARIAPQTRQDKPRCWTGRTIGKWLAITRTGASGAPGVGVGAGDAHYAGARNARCSAGHPVLEAGRSPSELGWRPPSVPSGTRCLLAMAVAE